MGYEAAIPLEGIYPWLIATFVDRSGRAEVIGGDA